MLRIGAWNITSWTKKQFEVISELNNRHIKICALGETKTKGSGNYIIDNFVYYYSGVEPASRAVAGVGLLIDKQLNDRILEVQYINERILNITMQLSEKTKYNVISVYAPDSGKPVSEYEEFLNTLQRVIDNLSTNNSIIILGDLNARIGDEVIPHVKQAFNESVRNDQGELLCNFCIANSLRITNTYFPHKQQHKITWCNTRNHHSTIDHVIVNRNVKYSSVLDVRALNTGHIGTDHNLVLCKLRLQEYKKRQRDQTTNETERRWNVELLEQESIRRLYVNRLGCKIQNNRIEPDDTVEEAHRKIEANINAAAEEAIGARDVNRAPKKNTKPWYMPKVKELTSTKRVAYQKYKNIGTEAAKNDYRVIRNLCQSELRSIRKDYWESFTQSLQYDLYGRQSKIWAILRKSRIQVNEQVQIPLNINTFHKHFTDLLMVSNDNQIQPVNDNINFTRITIDTDAVNTRLCSMRNRKATGPDNINMELLKYGNDQLTAEIVELFNRCVATNRIPTEWNKSWLIPVHKKGSKTDPNNYRGISLMNNMAKLFTGVILDIVNQHYTSRQEQFGFRRGRSTTDAIFIMRQIIEKAVEYNRHVYVCYIDFVKAFDNIRITDVVNILIKRGLPRVITNIIKTLNTDLCTQIKTKYGTSSQISITNGIRQGDSLSPALFNVVMDEIIEAVTELNLGYDMKSTKISMVCYADDAALIAQNEDDLQRLLYRLQIISNNYGLKISSEKTKSAVYGKTAKRCKLVVNNVGVEQVGEFKYLGVNLSTNNNLTQEVKTQAHKALQNAAALNSMVFCNNYMSTSAKVRIYKTCIRPILTYAAECRTDTARTTSISNAAEMLVLRRILKKTRRDRIRNDDIRETCGISPITRFVRNRRKEWNRHINRRTNQELIKAARDGIPNQGKRPMGRPPKRWKEAWTSGSQEAD